MIERITSATYWRGAYVGGVLALVALIGLGIVMISTGTPPADILLAAPGLLIGFGTLWYYFLNNPDPTLLMPNIVPLRDGEHVASQIHRKTVLNDETVVIEPVERDSPNGPLASFLAPWRVEWETAPSDLYLVFDIGNRGNQGVMLYEYRLLPAGDRSNPVIVSLSPESQVLELAGNGDDSVTPTETEPTGQEHRAFVQPKERITEHVRLPIDVDSVMGSETYRFSLELYATSGRPVDSFELKLRVDTETGAVEWQANRSPLQRWLRATGL
ncbi:hypothetical protein [Haloarchaeobius amylolyticus]|uniref:hypothetical protein n=1 Tax=Haloarchaeobius amylolyticus TaxID=1198296 RepID=UPI002271EBCA|nr:hypothetical protein [Haloarchaeobius amylolyticus]